MDVRVDSWRRTGRSISSERFVRPGGSMPRLRIHDDEARDLLPFPAKVPERRPGDDPFMRLSPAELDATMDRMQRKLDELQRLTDEWWQDDGPRAA